MASGGYQPTKETKSESGRQTNWQRSVSSDDVQSTSSDLRINNWPQNPRQDSKHQKKSKDNPEREREQSLLAESPPIDKRHHTPTSYPRTKITPSTPTSQRVALENLKQHITFSDIDDDQVSADAGTQNKWESSQSRKKLQNSSFNRSASGDDVSRENERPSNSNNNMQYSSNEDEMSQNSRSHQKNRPELNSDGDEKDHDDCEQPLLRADGQLTDSSHPTNATQIENFVSEQEMSQPSQVDLGGATVMGGFVIPASRQELLNILRLKEQQLQAVMSRQAELNLKVSETAKKLQDAKVRDDRASSSLAALSESRKVIEHKQTELNKLKAVMMDTASKMAEQEEEEDGAYGQERQLKSNIICLPDSDDQDNEEDHQVENLPDKLLELKRQFSFLKNEFSQINQAPNNVDTETRALRDGRLELQNKLEELQNKKHQLDQLLQHLQVTHSQPSNQLRNGETSPPSVSSIQQTASAVSSFPPTYPPQQHPQPVKPTKLRTSSNSSLNSNRQAGAREVNEAKLKVREIVTKKGGNQLEAGGMDYLLLQEMQEKLRQLQLQTDSQGGISHEPQKRRQQSEQRHLPQQKQSQHKQLQQHHQLYQQQNNPQPNQVVPERPHQKFLPQFGQQQQSHGMMGTQQSVDHSDEENASVSRSEDLWPDFGSWENGDQMKEKIRKLRDAKEKLRELQDLVSLAQQSPDTSRTVAENLRDFETVRGQAAATAPHVSQTQEFISQTLGDSQGCEDADELTDPRAEIERLRRERAMLVEIQNQLQYLQNQKTRTQNGELTESKKQNLDKEKAGLNQTAEPVVVTFASNDELYGKIRRQRILHEELQTKRRELEDIVRNGDKRSNSRNQDNQSDVSLNTDGYGISTSVVATWGSSAAENLDNGTQDESGRNDDGDEERSIEETDKKIPSKRQSRNSRNIQRQVQLIKTWPQDYGQSKKQTEVSDTFRGEYSQWVHAIESKLFTLTTAVDALMRKSQAETRQKHAFLPQETGSQSHSAQLYPVQEQMFQLQTMLLSFNQLVQSLTRQQGDIQYLQQQIHALQLQIQAMYNQQSFPVSPTAGGGLPNRLHPPQSHPGINSGAYQAAARSGVDGRSSSQASSGLGGDHTLGSGAHVPLPQERMTATFVLPLGQPSFDQHCHQASTEGSLISTSIHEFAQVKGNHRAQDENLLSQDVSSSFHDAQKKKRSQTNSAGSNSNAENVRDAIYEEVNSLITQNESRPYFLLELFRDMRQIDSDLLRQLTLNSLQHLLQAHSTSNTATSFIQCPEEITSTEGNQPGRLARNSAMVYVPFDYSKAVNSGSSLAAPSSTESSTFQYPQVDMKQLDQQIKNIMMRTVPIVKLHLNDVCSFQLLSYIRHLVTSFVDRLGDQEFVQLFQHQLTTLLESTLRKYEGRRMRECGEALLVDISDVLYNELAFFRLMQNLDEPVVDGRTGDWASQVSDNQITSNKPMVYLRPEETSGDDNSFDSNEMLDDRDKLRRFGWIELERDEVMKDHKEGKASKSGLQEVLKWEDESMGLPHKTEPEPSNARPINRPGTAKGDKKKKTKAQRDTAAGQGSILDSQRLPVVPTMATLETERDLERDEEREQLTKAAVGSNATNNHEELTTPDPSLMLAAPSAQSVSKGNSVNAPSAENDGSQKQKKSRFEEEQRSLNGLDAILASLGGMEELAGDEASVLDPDYFVS